MYATARTGSLKQGAANIPAATPPKVAKKREKMVESDSKTESKEESLDVEEDAVMVDNTGDTGEVKKKGSAKKKKKAGFEVEERFSKLIELEIKIDPWDLPIPSVIKEIALALDYINKSAPNIGLRLEKLKGGDLIVPSTRGIPDNWVTLAKYVRMINDTASATMKKAAKQGDTAQSA